jgi:hypothetical protein
MGVMPLSGDERVPPSAPGGPPTIALLHATYHRPGGVGPLRDAWLGRADRADLVDYIVAMDGDDPAVRDTAGWHRVVGPPSDGTVSAVRNWNAAAAASSADLLVVLADDLFPEPGWDTTLRRMLDGWDPQAVAYAVKITDSPDPGRPRCCAIRSCPGGSTSRRGSSLHSCGWVYCDDEITRRAYWRALILDGRRLAFDHAHPTLTGQVETTSHHLVNRDTEHALGVRVYEGLWPKWRRRAAIRLAPTSGPLVGHPRAVRGLVLTPRRRGCRRVARPSGGATRRTGPPPSSIACRAIEPDPAISWRCWRPVALDSCLGEGRAP